MGSSTSDRLLFRNTMRIKSGHLDEFRKAILSAVNFAEQNAPQLLVDVFIDESELTATSFQLYADSEAVLQNWALSDPYSTEVMRHCTIARFEVFGSPSATVLDGLGQSSRVTADITPRLVGYLADSSKR